MSRRDPVQTITLAALLIVWLVMAGIAFFFAAVLDWLSWVLLAACTALLAFCAADFLGYTKRPADPHTDHNP